MRWTEEKHKELLSLVYKGYTMDGVANEMGIKTHTAAARLHTLGTGFYKIKSLKKSGATLKDILKMLEEKKEPVNQPISSYLPLSDAANELVSIALRLEQIAASLRLEATTPKVELCA